MRGAFGCGHPRTPENTSGWRRAQCRTCMRAAGVRYDAAHREERNAKGRAYHYANREEILHRMAVYRTTAAFELSAIKSRRNKIT